MILHEVSESPWLFKTHQSDAILYSSHCKNGDYWKYCYSPSKSHLIEYVTRSFFGIICEMYSQFLWGIVSALCFWLLKISTADSETTNISLKQLSPTATPPLGNMGICQGKRRPITASNMFTHPCALELYMRLDVH